MVGQLRDRSWWVLLACKRGLASNASLSECLTVSFDLTILLYGTRPELGYQKDSKKQHENRQYEGHLHLSQVADIQGAWTKFYHTFVGNTPKHS